MERRDDLSQTLYPKAVKAIRQGNVDEAIQSKKDTHFDISLQSRQNNL